MDNSLLLGFIITIAIPLTIYFFDKRKKKTLKSDARIQINKISNFLDEYEMKILESFDKYKEDKLFYDFNLNQKEKVQTTSEYYLDADVENAFSIISTYIVKNQTKLLDLDEDYGPNQKRYNLIKDIFSNGTERQKLNYIHNNIIFYSILVAVGYSFSEDSKSNLTGNGAEFIALREFNIETYLGKHYPEDDYKRLYKLLKERLEYREMTPQEFWMEKDLYYEY